jgi:hypothetical protein
MEAEVDIILPSIGNDLTSLIMREGTFLRTSCAPVLIVFFS